MAQEELQGISHEAGMATGSPGQEVRPPRLNRRNCGLLVLAALASGVGVIVAADSFLAEGEAVEAAADGQNQAIAGFPECDFAHDGFVEVDQQRGDVYQCRGGKWVNANDDTIREEIHPYVNLQRDFDISVGGVNMLHGEASYEQFIPGDIEASLKITAGQATLVDVKVNRDK